jgi:hypothetical protein
MSYVLAFTPEAHLGFRQLDPNLQEDVLDELDRLAADPSLLPPRRVNDIVYFDVVRDRAKIRHFVFVTIGVSHARQLLEIVRIGAFQKPRT